MEGHREEPLGGKFTARQAWHPLRNTYRQVPLVAGGFEVLIQRNYIIEPHQADYRERGRPSREFIVNPRISEDWK